MRTFIAIEIPTHIRAKIEQQQHSLTRVLGDPPVRWVRPESIHLTLKFLGEIDTQQAQHIGAQMPTISGQCAAMQILVGGMGCFPNFNRPRVIWIGLEDQTGQLVDLHQKLERWLQSLGFTPEKGGYSPHLTIARVQRQVDNRRRKDLGEKIAAMDAPALGGFSADSVHLFRSELKPTGAVYTRLATARLRVDHE